MPLVSAAFLFAKIKVLRCIDIVMLYGTLTPEDAANRAGMSVEEFKDKAGLQ